MGGGSANKAWEDEGGEKLVQSARGAGAGIHASGAQEEPAEPGAPGGNRNGGPVAVL